MTGMRIGENPANFATQFKRPAPVTVTMTTYIPFRAGYFEHSFDVLKLCLASLQAHTTSSYDLMVLDNGSCREVLDYLKETHSSGGIQFLFLSRENVGYEAGISLLLSAAPGEYVAHADSDVYFCPGWLDEEMKVLEAFENVGMVSGLPAMHCFGLNVSSTLSRAQADPATLTERGQFMPDEWIIEWGTSLGREPDEFLAFCRRLEQIRLTRNGVTAYAVSPHFQFLARTDVVRRFAPFRASKVAMDTIQPMFDEPMDRAGYMRLSVSRPVVHHLGNALTPRWRVEAERLGLSVSSITRPDRSSLLSRLLRRRLLRRAVFEIYHRVSHLVSFY